MRQLIWKYRATAILLFVLASAVFGGFDGNSQEKDCLIEVLGLDNREANICLIAAGIAGGASSRPEPPARGAALAFETNLGQADTQFEFLAQANGATVYLSRGAATLDLRDAIHTAPKVLRASFAGSRPVAEPVVEEPLGHVNYFLGNNPDRWITDVPTFRRVRYRNIYPGIDVVYYGADGALEHDVIVHPGADPATVAMAFEGAEDITLDSKGSAIIRAGGRLVEWKKPILYQEAGGRRVTVEGRYQKNGQTGLRFEVGRYDASRALIIDPVVTYASYQGRSPGEGAMHVAVDAQGNTYVSGFTRDGTFPITPGAYTPSTGAGNVGNGFIIKYNAANTAVVYSTYIGGSLADGFTGVAVDPSGNAYLAGTTRSADYPVTTGALKTQLRPPGSLGAARLDCVVTKLNAAGNALAYSTYLGGNDTDACFGISVDSQGNSYIAGATSEALGFPLGDNAPVRQVRGAFDAFVVKLNPTGTRAIYGTLLGGQDADSAMAIAVDAQGAAYITGQTVSPNLPVTSGALQRAFGGSALQPTVRFGDAFVAKLSPDGGTFDYVTYLGGRTDDIGLGIAVDGQGNAYVTGSTISDTFPITPGAFQTVFKGLSGNALWPGGDAFVAKLNPAGTALLYSTYLGGSKDDWATAIALDSAGNAWVTGATLSSNFPTSADAAQKINAGGDPTAVFPTGDAWVAQLNPSGASLTYSSYLGGKGDDYALGIALDSSGGVYLAGSTRSSDFPTTANALQKGYGGTDYSTIPLGDIFVARVGPAAIPPPPSSVSISGVASAASYAGGGVAPGEIVVLAGAGIGPKDLVGLTVVGGTKIGAQSGGTQVLFDDQPAPLLYASVAQTSVIVPYSVSGKSSTQLVVVYNGERSAPMTVPVLQVHPALFSANASGRGQGAILNEDNSYNSRSLPAVKGHIVQLFGTGEGQTNPGGLDGLLALLQLPKPLANVMVTIGGQQVIPDYAGAAPQAVAGLIQINVKIPVNAASGDREIIIQIGTARSQTGLTVAVQ